MPELTSIASTSTSAEPAPATRFFSVKVPSAAALQNTTPAPFLLTVLQISLVIPSSVLAANGSSTETILTVVVEAFLALPSSQLAPSAPTGRLGVELR